MSRIEDLDLENWIALSTRELYEWNMRHLVIPAFEHLALHEVSVYEAIERNPVLSA